MCCFDFCSSVKSSKALGLPANCLRSSVLLRSGVRLLGAAAQCCLETTEGTSQPVVFAIHRCAKSTRCLLTASSVSTAWRLCFLMFLSSSPPPLALAGSEWSLGSSGRNSFSRSHQLKALFPPHAPASCQLQQLLVLITAALSKATV